MEKNIKMYKDKIGAEISADEMLTKFWKVETTLTNEKGLSRTKKAKACFPVGGETNKKQDDSFQRTPR